MFFTDVLEAVGFFHVHCVILFILSLIPGIFDCESGIGEDLEDAYEPWQMMQRELLGIISLEMGRE